MMPPQIVLISARADNGVIGVDGGLPWHVSVDLKRFKQMTIGKPVVMGRKSFESIGKPLPGRHNIVLTRVPQWRADGVTVVSNLAEAVAAAGLGPNARADTIMVIGGGEIYEQAMPSATRIELTEVHIAPEGDTRFPPIDPACWRETFREAHAAEGDAPAFDFVTLQRI